MPETSSYNVLWILADEFRPDCLGIAGNPLIHTPHLDALAKEGTLMRNAFCQASPCAPSRACLYTGRYMCSHGVVDNLTPLAEGDNTLISHLRHHGVVPALLGYNDYAPDPRILPPGHPQRSSLSYDYCLPGFDVVLKHEYDSPEWYQWLEEQGYPPESCNRETMYSHQIPAAGRGGHELYHYPAYYRAEHSESRFLTGKAIDYIQSHKAKPWFLNINYLKPHGPYICPAPYHEMFAPESMPEPLRRIEEIEQPHPYFSRLRGDFAQQQFVKEQEWRELRACYYGMVSEIDACIGVIFDYLRETGLWDRTLIIFSADHGACLGDHYLFGKPHFFDSTMRIPFIVRDPRPCANSGRGKQRSSLAQSIDTAPTLCDFLGIPVSPAFQGKSILSATQHAQEAPLHETIFYEFYYYNLLKNTDGIIPEECRIWVARDCDFKYVCFGEKDMEPLLFNLREDPGEFRNLANAPDMARVAADYCGRLLRWRMRHEDYRMEQWARPLR